MMEELTVKQARKVLQEARKYGPIDCPTCDKRVQEYKKTISKMWCLYLRDLVRIYEQNGGEWVHCREIIESNSKASTEGVTFRHWGMLQMKQKEFEGQEEKDIKGYHRPTQRGIDFVKHGEAVPAWCTTYNGVAIEWADEYIKYRDAKLIPFDLEEAIGPVRSKK